MILGENIMNGQFRKEENKNADNHTKKCPTI